MSRGSMNPGFDQRIADWLEDDPDDAPEAVLATVLAAFPSIPQRRATRVPWRFPIMSTFSRLAVAAIAVLVVGAAGILALRPGTNAGGSLATPPPTSSLTPSPTSVPTDAAAPSVPPPLSQEFSSARNGISMAYPAGWQVRRATAPWSATLWPDFADPAGDVLYDGTLMDHLFIVLASQQLSGRPADQWTADAFAADRCTSTLPVTIDGAAGRIGADCDMAAVTRDGRGYIIVFSRSPDEAWLAQVYDRAWFEHVLTTVKIGPTPSASPAPSASR